MSARETRAAGLRIGTHILPQTEDGVIKWPDDRRSRQTRRDIATWLIHSHEVEASVGINVNRVIGVAVQFERERQRHCRVTVIHMVSRVRRARHDRIGSRGYDVLGGRATLYCVISCESRVRVTECVCDRPGGNIRDQSPTKGATDREADRRVSGKNGDPGYAGTSGAA